MIRLKSSSSHFFISFSHIHDCIFIHMNSLFLFIIKKSIENMRIITPLIISFSSLFIVFLLVNIPYLHIHLLPNIHLFVTYFITNRISSSSYWWSILNNLLSLLSSFCQFHFVHVFSFFLIISITLFFCSSFPS